MPVSFSEGRNLYSFWCLPSVLQVFSGVALANQLYFILRHPMYAGSSALSQVDRNHSFIQPHKNEIAGYMLYSFSLLPNGETVNWVTSLHCTEAMLGSAPLQALWCWCKLLLLSLLSVACMHQNYTDSINTASSKTETSSLGNLWKAWNVSILFFLLFLLSPARDYKPGQKRSQVKWKGSLTHFNNVSASWLVIGFTHVGTATSQLVSRVFK